MVGLLAAVTAIPSPPSPRGSANRRAYSPATYAQRIKKKTGTARNSPPRPVPKAGPAAAPKAAPAVESGEVRRLKDELQRVNQEISKIARLTRPGADPARNSQLPEKQQLLVQRLDLERKIRALSKS